MANITSVSLRAQAQQCRDLAVVAEDLPSRELMIAIAEDFEAEAERLEGDQPRLQIPPPSEQ